MLGIFIRDSVKAITLIITVGLNPFKLITVPQINILLSLTDLEKYLNRHQNVSLEGPHIDEATLIFMGGPLKIDV